MPNRSKPSKRASVGMRLEANRLGIEPEELSGGNLDDARKIDRAIRRAVKARDKKWREAMTAEVTGGATKTMTLRVWARMADNTPRKGSDE